MSVYVITGANRGLGLEFVRQLSSTPTNIIIAAVRTLTNDLTDLEALQKAHNNVHILECDTGKRESVEKFRVDLEKTLSPTNKKIDYLLNNAAINITPQDKSLTLTRDSLHEYMDVNVLGPQMTTEVLLPLLAEKKTAVIMHMSSSFGSIGRTSKMQYRFCATYSLSKAALDMLAVHQAFDLKDRVKAVIVMDPGRVKTRMGGDDAPRLPEESIRGMLQVLHGLREEDNGKFFEWSGGEVEW